MPLSALFDGYATPDAAERASILIVDDLPEKLLVFETILADLDQHLVIARSGSEALREVLRQQFAVILMDVNMPGIDGLETARLIRGYRRSAHTPIIFVTAYADELQTAQGYSLGAVDYILSPVIPDVLRSKVRVFVDLFIMQQRLRQQALERIAIARAEAAQRAAEENTRRSIFLAQAGRELADSLDADVAMRRLLSLLVPNFAPRALLWLRDAGHGHERVLRCDASTAAGEPCLLFEGREQMLSEVLYNATRDAIEQMMPALLPGDATASQAPTSHAPPTFAPAFPPGLPGPSDDDETPPRALLRRDIASGVVLPLVAGERMLGGLLLADPHQPPDWPTLEELAGRAAIAFENARLYGALQAEIVERRQAEAGLLEASRRKDEFLAMLSHELRNPLAPIRNAIEVMRTLSGTSARNDADDTSDSGELRDRDRRLGEAVAVTDRQARHLTRLVDELLDVARISQGKIVLKTETLDLRDIVRHGLEPVQSLIDGQGQQLRLALPDRPAKVRGDAARLIQVVTNLLHNASKYTGAGGRIELTLVHRNDDSAGHDGHDGRDGAFVLTVRDNGRGIAASLLPHVFDLFEQGPRGLDRNQGGLGVGLTLVQRLVQLHHGQVEARSDGPGHGSTFEVRLPAAVDEAHGASPAAIGAPEHVVSARAEAAGGHDVRDEIRDGARDEGRNDGHEDEGPCRVMVVDDNRDAADSMAVFLELAGFDTTVQLDGPGALDAAPAWAPHVVLLDIGLPGLDGYEVARRLRALPGGMDWLLIALTGYGQQDDRRRAHEAGFDVHLVKPADPDAVVELIQEWRQRDRTGRPAEAAAR